MHPDSFNVPIIVETVRGAWTEALVRGDPALEPAHIAAARRLVERGAIAISSTCGFTIRHQRALAAAVEVPVVSSSLLLLPILLRQVSPDAKVAIVTYDSRYLGGDVLAIISDPPDRARVVVGGIEGGKYWHDARKRPMPPVDTDAIEQEVGARIDAMRAEHPRIAAVLLECHAFPSVAPAMRRQTKLPVYCITDLCRMTLEAIAQSNT